MTTEPRRTASPAPGGAGPVAGDLAMAVVVRRGLVLVQRRHRRNVGFVHEFPGGAVEAGETWAAAASRELLEETGLRESDALLCSVQGGEDGRHVAFVVFDSRSSVPPSRTNERRRQSFLWLAPGAIPLHDLHAADRRFVTGELSTVLGAGDHGGRSTGPGSVP